jgi:DNA-binding GntR family transcriptional regulator
VSSEREQRVVGLSVGLAASECSRELLVFWTTGVPGARPRSIGHDVGMLMSKAAERAYESIREGITSGGYTAGSRLREQELSALIGVSRTPVREALRRLSAEGIVEFIPNRGAHVASWTDSDLEEIFELRALLESQAARRAATRIDDEGLDQLKDLASQMEALLAKRSEGEAIVEISRLNNEFHQLILEASGSRQLVTTTKGVIQVALVRRTFARYSGRALERSFAHHRELIESLVAGDSAWAGSVMHSHILAARHIFSPVEPDQQAS